MLASILDCLLVALAGLTLSLIIWKVIELYLPGTLGRLRIESAVAGDSELDELLERAEQGVPMLATIAATAPFIGLAATVLHIMKGLELLGGSMLEATVLAGPIATALNSTILGLASAVPAAAAYNLLARRLQLAENRARRRIAGKQDSQA